MREIEQGMGWGTGLEDTEIPWEDATLGRPLLSMRSTLGRRLWAARSSMRPRGAMRRESRKGRKRKTENSAIALIVKTDLQGRISSHD